MEHIKDRFDDAEIHVKFNLVMICIWAVLLVPTMLMWQESVMWIVVMSWYANFVGHISAFVASKAEVAADKGS